MKQLITKFIADEQGQDIIEYALLGSFVSFGAYLGASALGTAYSRGCDLATVGVGTAKAIASTPLRARRAAFPRRERLHAARLRAEAACWSRSVRHTMTMHLLRRWLIEEDGQDLIEYALLASFLGLPRRAA